MIFVSAGHYVERPGACFGDFCEHGEALIWRSLLTNYLGHEGMVVPTGTLREKVEFINDRAEKGDIAVEIHFNDFTIWEDANKNGLIDDGELRQAGRGSETLYYPGSTRGKEVALVAQSALAQNFQPDRGVKEGWYRMNPDNGPDFFLAKTRCTSIIVEPDFISRKAKITGRREQTCELLAEYLLQFINEET